MRGGGENVAALYERRTPAAKAAPRSDLERRTPAEGRPAKRSSPAIARMAGFLPHTAIHPCAGKVPPLPDFLARTAIFPLRTHGSASSGQRSPFASAASGCRRVSIVWKACSSTTSSTMTGSSVPAADRRRDAGDRASVRTGQPELRVLLRLCRTRGRRNEQVHWRELAPVRGCMR